MTEDFNDKIKQSKKTWALYWHEIIHNNFKETDNIEIIKQITNELDDCIEYNYYLIKIVKNILKSFGIVSQN